MANNELTFEQVNEHFEKADLSQFQKGGANFFEATNVSKAPGDVLQKVCGIYQVVRPFLKLVANLPLIPQKWKDAIKTFTDLMDSLCP
ncbi:MAG: hypothetical protein J7527_10385 [Chitinophagaceae bacterium]|nr:hypothetical protein [Chitinophagaceae bacterium]